MSNNPRRHFLGVSSLLTSLCWFSSHWACAQEGANLQLWVEVDLSNRSNRVGQAIVKGVEKALVQAAWLKVQLKIINHQGNPDRLMDQLQALAPTANSIPSSILGLVGGGDANLAPLVARWAAGHDLPYAMTWASNPRLIEQINAAKANPVPGALASSAVAPLMRMAVTDDAVFTALIGWMRSRQERRWGLLLANDVLGRAAYDYILENIELSSAFELVGIQWHSLQAQEIALHYQILRRRGAQNVLAITHPRALAVLLQSLSGSGAKIAPLICSSNAWSQELIARNLPGNLPIYFAMPKQIDFSKDHPATVFAQQLSTSLLQTPVSRLPLRLDGQHTAQEQVIPFGLMRYNRAGESEFWMDQAV